MGIFRIDNTGRLINLLKSINLIVQKKAILFYLPKYVWKSNDGGKLEELCKKINRRPVNELNDKERTKLLIEINDSLMTGSNSLKLFIYCEMYFLIHLIGEIWFIDLFLNKKFYSLGTDWLNYLSSQLDDRHDPLIELFPRLAKCIIHKYGSTGEIERNDVLCFLNCKFFEITY